MKRIYSVLMMAVMLIGAEKASAACTVYYAGTYATPYVYAWNGSGQLAAWPGKAMEATGETYGGKTVYKFTFAVDYPNCIFSNNGSPKTADLLTQCDKIWYGDSWANYTPGSQPTDTIPDPEMPTTFAGVPSESEDVMLQGFYWNSYSKDFSTTQFGRTIWTDFINNNWCDSIANSGFTMVWFPSPCRGDGLGYHPQQWSNLDSQRGAKTTLVSLISQLHQRGVKSIADIVVNHRESSSGWCKFFIDNFGSKYGSTEAPSGQYSFNSSHICADDEAFTDPKSSCYGGSGSGNADSGEQLYEAARDLDHTLPYVRSAVKSYLKFLQGEAGFDGWRYDLVKGYSPKYLAEYNIDSKPYLSVGEYYDYGLNNLEYFLERANYQTMLFDFPLKGSMFVGSKNNMAAGIYRGLLTESGNKLHKVPGKSKFAITFVDNHDTFRRSDQNGGGNEYLGANTDITKAANRYKILEANAYILSMPGIPCVFWPHWYKWKDEIGKMIEARKLVGIHSESEIIEESAKDGTTGGYYQATIQGHRGKLVLQMGPGMSSLGAPEGYTLFQNGARYRMYVKIEDGTGVESNEKPAMKAFKGLENGRVVIYVNGRKYDILGR